MFARYANYPGCSSRPFATSAVLRSPRVVLYGSPMSKFGRIILILLGLILTIVPLARAGFDDGGGSRSTAPRIVSVGGSLTEIVYALGASDALVGTDTSSGYPEAATRLPQVGYQRRLSAEGVLSLNPTLVLATADAGPPAAMEQIRSAGVPVLTAPSARTPEGIKEKIRTVAQALGREERGEELTRVLDADLLLAKAFVAGANKKPRVLFIYARGQGTMMVSGSGTSAHTMIQLSGAENAVSGYDNYKPLTAEAVVAAEPDVILMLSSGLASLGGVDGLLKAPGVALTPAGMNRRIVAMDGLYLLGFGPRTGKAVLELAREFHSETCVSREQ